MVETRCRNNWNDGKSATTKLATTADSVGGAKHVIAPWVLDELDEGDEEAPRVRAVHNESLQQDPGDGLLHNLGTTGAHEQTTRLAPTPPRRTASSSQATPFHEYGTQMENSENGQVTLTQDGTGRTQVSNKRTGITSDPVSNRCSRRQEK